MSSPLSLGAVSAVLRNLLDNGLVDTAPALGTVKVTAVAPDTIAVDEPDAPPSLNLFLYRVTPNQGWRNTDLPAYDGDGARRTNPPLALDLHYLLTAYGSADFQAEIMLGYAMYLLHERPVLDRAAIRRALDPNPLGPSILPPAFQALTAADLADQAEAITVTPEPLDTEELARLWSAMQAHYRPTAGYVVSVVLIQATKPSRPALPVLTRGPVDRSTGRDRGVVVEPSLLPPFPTLERVGIPHARQAARLGDTITLFGHHLAGASATAHFGHRLLDEPNEVAVGTVTDPHTIEVPLPSGADAERDWPAGLWTVTVSVVPPGAAESRRSTAVALPLAPRPSLPPVSVARDAATGAVTVVLDVRPRVRPAQSARLALGGTEAEADEHRDPLAPLTFRLPGLTAGPKWARLTVDGVESLLVDRSAAPPVFDPGQAVDVPS
ncbi:DUF4255 domain-containing protein [Streptomyces sp. NPDC001652]|uniref:DUF4255 domain-containing protein n=1 Tax=Streptomyces sp. NPDC001652 TaxID=3154393 RepID=UPI003323AEE5